MSERRGLQILVAGTALTGTIYAALLVLGKKGGVAGQGIAEIVDVDRPASAAPGEIITVTVTLRNAGEGAGGLYAYIKDKDTGALVAAKAYTDSLPVGSSAQVQWLLSMPGKNWNLVVWGGHVAP